MKRRSFLKGVLAATAAPGVLVAQTVGKAVPPASVTPGPLPWMQGLDHVEFSSVRTIDLTDIAQPELYFFSTEQMKTLRRLSDVLVPPLNGYPGAVEAKTPEFLDFFVSKGPQELKTLYLYGLDLLEAQAKKEHGAAFAELNAKQIDGLIKPMLATWMPEHYPEMIDKHFMNEAHNDIRTATRNSPAWANADAEHGKRSSQGELYWSPVQPVVG